MKRLLAILLVLPGLAPCQGFGKIKKSITLQRKLPALVKLPGTAFNVKTSSSNAQYKDAAQRLQQVIETELARYDNRLTVDPQKPDTVISVSVLNFSVPPPVPVTQSVPLSFNNKGKAPPTVTTYKISGSLAVAYQAKTRAGAFVDSSNLTAKFSQEYNAQGGKADKGLDMVKKPFEKIKHLAKPSTKTADDEEEAPRTVGDVEQLVMAKMTALIAARLVNTDEKVQVFLARGALDDANKLAEAGQWTRMVEALETMRPFPDLTQDAYRLYNIGVGYEALGYAAETPAATQKNLEKAAIDYGKAIDANPLEKYFIEPQNRIEIAMQHFKKLSVAPAAKKSAPKKGGL